jgi:hypothetical protein
MVSGAGCGKSRNATEFPKTLRKIFASDPELSPRLLEALTFNIPLENGTKISATVESNANIAIAKRMLYQLQSQAFTGLKFVMICKPYQLLIFLQDVLNKKT